MRQVYNLLDSLKDHFEANGITNKVTFGDAYEFDIDKTTMMPLAHINLLGMTYRGRTVVYRVAILCLDWVDQSKEVDNDNDFYGSTNLHDVLNGQNVVVLKFLESLRRGDLYNEQIRLFEDTEPQAEAFQDTGDNRLAGWGIEVQIEMPNDVSVC